MQLDYDSQTEIDDLNKEFYKNYDTEYFINKSHLLLLAICKTEDIAQLLSEELAVGSLNVKEGDIKSDKLSNMAKVEIVANYYHTIESFFRLLVGHYEAPECPWLGVVSITNFTEFKKKVAKISARTLITDMQLESLFFGKKPESEKIATDPYKENLKRLEEVIIRLGQDLLKPYDYNAFKHGKAIFDTQFGFQLDDGAVLSAKSQDSFLTLRTEYDKEKHETHYSKAFSFMEWEQKFALTFMTTQLMENLIQVGALRTKVKTSAHLNTFQGWDMSKIFGTGIFTDSVTMSLSTYKRDTKKGPRSKHD